MRYPFVTRHQMKLFRSRAFVRYAIGFACLLVGAAVSGETHSMLPLAMGSAVAVLCTVSLVRDIRAGAARRRAGAPRR